MCEFVERMTKACSLSRREDNARSCTQVPRRGHADAASNRKSWTNIYYGQTNVLSCWLAGLNYGKIGTSNDDKERKRDR